MANKPYEIGAVVTCRLGNPTDTHGYVEQIDVTVMGHIVRECVSQPLYLIKVNGMNKIGRATVPNPNPLHERFRIPQQLYCTAACSYGDSSRPDRPATLEDAIKYLF